MILVGYRLANLLRRLWAGSRRFWRGIPGSEGTTVSKAEELVHFPENISSVLHAVLAIAYDPEVQEKGLPTQVVIVFQ
jgi:hypothetical protein